MTLRDEFPVKYYWGCYCNDEELMRKDFNEFGSNYFDGENSCCSNCWTGPADDYGIIFYVDEDFNYLSAAVCIAFGGPNIWVDGHSGKEEYYNWGEYRENELDKEWIVEFNEHFFGHYITYLEGCSHSLTIKLDMIGGCPECISTAESCRIVREDGTTYSMRD